MIDVLIPTRNRPVGGNVRYGAGSSVHRATRASAYFSRARSTAILARNTSSVMSASRHSRPSVIELAGRPIIDSFHGVRDNNIGLTSVSA